MRFLIAPDKYKGTLTAQDASHAIARGVRAACAKQEITPEIDLCPLSDGGEGFLDIMAHTLGARIEFLDTLDPLGEPIRVPVGFLGDGYREAIIESAKIIGLHLVPEEKRDPAQLTTIGIGTLLVELARKGCTKVTIGLGGSATIDGGIGMAAALGYRFLDTADNELPAIGASLANIARIEQPEDHPLEGVHITAACDVDNPLLGEHGAAIMYGPQKGASTEQVERLDAGLANLLRVTNVEDRPFFGTAGGVPLGLVAFTGAQHTAGAKLVLDIVGFTERASNADLVMTGEGSLDAQTVHAKVCATVAALSPVIALPGRCAPDADVSAFAGIRPCAPFDAPLPSASEAADRLTRAAHDAVLSFLP